MRIRSISGYESPLIGGDMIRAGYMLLFAIWDCE